MILLIDNYDSFSYNLVQLTGEIRTDILAVRNDKITVGEIASMNPDHIILSPGPGYPQNAGVCEETIQKLGSRIPILGVCLGHQAICEVFGGKIIKANQLMHGKQSRIKIIEPGRIFLGMGQELLAARYHSLIAKKQTLPKEFLITAEDKNGEVMAVEHIEYPIFGVQFHPESILTENGVQIMKNFLAC